MAMTQTSNVWQNTVERIASARKAGVVNKVHRQQKKKPQTPGTTPGPRRGHSPGSSPGPSRCPSPRPGLKNDLLRNCDTEGFGKYRCRKLSGGLKDELRGVLKEGLEITVQEPSEGFRNEAFRNFHGLANLVSSNQRPSKRTP